VAARTAVLIMIQGHEPGARWELGETRVTTIGRSSRNVISLPSPSVSRFHCEVSYINGLWYIADLNSKKGTFLNGRRISEREVLRPGDTIRLSRNVFRFDFADEAAAAGAGAVAEEPGAESQRVPPEPSAAEPAREESAAAGILARLRPFRGVALTGLLVGVVVGGALAYAHHEADRMWRRRQERLEAARAALAEASALVEAGPARYREALEALRRVVRDYPGSEAAQQAEALYAREEGMWLEREMQRITRSEQQEDYRDALERASDLLEGLSDEPLKALVRQRQEFTARLARAAYQRLDAQAKRLQANGDLEGAAALYEKAKERMGLPELIADAEAKLRALRAEGEQGGTGSAPAGGGASRAAQPTERDAAAGAARADEPQPPDETPSEEQLHRRMKPPPVLEP